MKRILLFGLVYWGGFGLAQGQDSVKVDSGWQISVNSGLALTQAAYSDNWAGGELGSFAWTVTSLTEATKQLSTRFNSKTTLKLAFGQTYTQRRDTAGEANWDVPQKSTDLIDLESVLRMTLHSFVDPYAALRLESQFFDGSVRSVKRYFSPAKITESAGALRYFINRPKKLELSSRLGFALRQIATKNILDTAAKATEWKTTNDAGIESVSDLKAQLRANLSYVSKLSLYKALFFSESDAAPNDYWKAVDANWEHILSADLTKYLQSSLYLQLLFDKQIDKGVRIKETLGMGLAYKI